MQVLPKSGHAVHEDVPEQVSMFVSYQHDVMVLFIF